MFGGYGSSLPLSNAYSLAPTARPIPAWGEAPGIRRQNARGLKARPIQRSIPQIPFVALHPVFLQECAHLILKILLPVMGLLRIDISDQRFQIRRANRECTIASLP